MRGKTAGRVAFKSLGCKLNQLEADSLATQFQDAGYNVVDFDDAADVYIVNSCTVTKQADRKSRNLLYRAMSRTGAVPVQQASGPGPAASAAAGSIAGASVHRARQTSAPGPARHYGPVVVMTGCYADAEAEALAKLGPTFVVGNDGKSRIFDMVDAYRRGETPPPDTTETGPAAHKTLAGSRFSYTTPGRLYHTRGMLKVQDGCDNFCSFCIIPHVRGRAVSRPRKEVLEEARALVDADYKEIVLTGVNISRYNHDGSTFSDLLESILELSGSFRLRISSLEPDRLDDHFIDLLGHPKMCPHLHLCLQSGSERILLSMRRQYTAAGYRRIAETIRERYPGFNLTTDVIVGYPGETEEDFDSSLQAVRDLEFGHVHTFRYSKRKGTRAERMAGHVTEKVKTERSEQIRVAAEACKRRYRESLVGSTEELLVEARRGDKAAGMGRHYVPIRTDHDKKLVDNTVYRVRIVSVDDDDDPSLSGELVKGLSSGEINEHPVRR